LLLGTVRVSAFDYNGTGGVSLADLGAWTADLFSGSNPQRADYDGNGVVTIADLSIWSSAFFGGNEPQSAGTLCP
jgi:hypothetical protein